MSKLIKEFKDFINRGNVMNLAVGVIIGGAFTSVVTSLTDNIINPFITWVTGGNGTEVGGLVVPGTQIDFGAFISAIINFLIVALVVFFLVKAVTKLQNTAEKLSRKQTAEKAPDPVCPYCLELVKPGARKCSHCGSDLPQKK